MRRTPRVLFPLAAAVLVLAGPCPARGDNVDPADDGHQWAWSENAGWINAQPLGPGGPGAQVGDFRVEGFLWSENLGWINLGCRDDGSCDDPRLGVRNDGEGHLSGVAWSENAGFIDFAPAGGGVALVATAVEGEAEFSGYAWGENVGWIAFSLDEGRAIRTTWSCEAGAAPGLVAGLVLGRAGGNVHLEWGSAPRATHYDVARGDLAALLATGGDFARAAASCLARKTATNSADDTDSGPAAGEGNWYLVRAARCGAIGSWDDPTAVSGRRDPGLGAAGVCP